MKCLECEKEFNPKSPLAKFCSAKCKQKNYRKSINELLKSAREKLPQPEVISYKETSKKSYDGKKINPAKLDEKVKGEFKKHPKESDKNINLDEILTWDADISGVKKLAISDEIDTTEPLDVDKFFNNKKVAKHKLWKEGDPAERTMAFYLKYNAYTYDEIKK